MYNPDTELIFPLRIIPSLAGLRGSGWKRLAQYIASGKATEGEQCAFVLLMVRLGGCVTCNSDSFRAMRGCTACANQTVRRIRNSDEDLIEQYNACKKEIEVYQRKRQKDGTHNGILR